MILHHALFELNSTAFNNSEEIPSKYTCDGNNVPPPLKWNNPPAGTKSFALIVDDPDAPDPAHPKKTWTHWLLYNIPADINNLTDADKSLPRGTLSGLNDWKNTTYGGPCPPIGRHRYFYKLYALDTELKNLKMPTKAILEDAMKGHILEKTELVGTYIKKNGKQK